jgi:uncharacterized protein (TIGR00297 family)
MDLGFWILIGTPAAIIIGFVAYRAGSLSKAGGVAAAVTGAIAVGAGWNWAALLIAYFVSSSALSRLGRARKLALTAGMVEKSGPRDAMQVIANGLPFTVLAFIWPDNYEPWGKVGAIMCGAAASLAASAADTWATEIGTWVGQAPRSIITWRRLPVGQSGGVTIAGLIGSVAGALFVALMARLVGWPKAMLPVIVVAGLLGSLVDSLLGALAQQRRWCDACAVATEMRVHACGAPSKSAGGIAFVNNDMVNLIASTTGALIGLYFYSPGAT